MALPSSGAISLSAVNTELGLSATATISMNDSNVRTLFGVASGAISMNNGYGKANSFNLWIGSNQTNANLRSLAVAAGWDQSKKVVATVAPSTYIYSTSTATPALTIDGSWPNGVTLINQGYIHGKGGDGGSDAAGSNGGIAISLGVSCTIDNQSYIAGGGGGGGGANGSYRAGGGGGAGGGAGGSSNGVGGGSGTYTGSTGISGTYIGGGYNPGGAGGGGSVFPGTGGAGATNSAAGQGGGSGGGGGRYQLLTSGTYYLGLGGGGGGWGASGGSGGVYSSGSSMTFSSNGTGGSAGSAGSNGSPNLALAGGSGGKAVNLNGYTVTWVTTGTRYGTIS